MQKFLATTAIAFLIASSANAASYSFSFIWDGSTLSEVGTDTMAGTILGVGDDFDLTLSAAGNGFWTWNGSPSVTLPLNPKRTGGNSAAHNATFGLSLDGAGVLSDTELPGTRCCADVGLFQLSGLSNGMEYDKISLSYEILWLSGSSLSLIGGFFNSKLWNSPLVTYTRAPVTSVPLPAGLPLLGVGVAALGLSRTFSRRRNSL